MWFKQVQLFQLSKSKKFTLEEIQEKLNDLSFTPCLPSMPFSAGWVSPVDQDDMPLAHMANGYIMLCLQIEEKILPAAVIRQELLEAIKQIETSEKRKLRQKEKFSLKDEISQSLLTRAFTKISRIYAYIDTNHHLLILGIANAKRADQFTSMFKKSISDEIYVFEVKNVADKLTHWVKDNVLLSAFTIQDTCLLQDPAEQKRLIRCQHQDLQSSAIQTLIKDGCDIKQLAMNWQDRVNFVLSADDFSLRSIQYQEELTSQAKEMEAETKLQQFHADFYIMSATLTQLFDDLNEAFTVTSITKNKSDKLVDIKNTLKIA
ncbi:MAG: hypothetical protein ACD_46C00311G0002 [uncultured bacterium]|nr:MAG: hypothetical protein ACD_46C00311G0002 [uncultured bacterium]